MKRWSRWADADPGEALRLREWTLRALAGRADAAAPAASPESWEFFLTLERCGLPLSRALEAAPRVLLDPAGRRAVDAAAATEIRLALAARAEIRRLDEIAAETSWKIVLLKGGSFAASSPPVHMQDLDVFLPGDEVALLAGRLHGHGYEERGEEHGRKAHLAQRRLSGSIPVEIHRYVRGLGAPDDLLARAVRCEGTRALWRLCDDDQLEHLLVHGMFQHPDRRGRIRDLVLLRHALDGARQPVAAAALPRAADVVGAEAVGAAVLLSRSFGRAPVSDAFRAVAARRYVLLTRLGGVQAVATTVDDAISLSSGVRSIGEELRRQAAAPLMAASRNRATNFVSRVPLLGRPVRASGRLARALIALALSRYARLRADRLLNSQPGRWTPGIPSRIPSLTEQ